MVTDKDTGERWVRIPGENWAVSDFGRMILTAKSGVNPAGKLIKFRQINRSHGRKPYLGTVLKHRDGKKRMVILHKLVAETFLGPRPPEMTINHKDCNKHNNHATNLEYITMQENTRHAQAHHAITHERTMTNEI